MTELSEQQIQNKIIRDAKKIPYKGRTLSDYIVHAANGGKRPKRTAAGLKHGGVRKGYPDLIIDIARNGYHGLRIELKDESGGVVSKEQKERLQMLSDEGYLAVIRSGYQAAFNEILDYMGIDR
ncbi:MAG: hypothetical protein BAX61_13330 [Psychrobacter sp. B29-1]|uniref:VRR-NUC domain-containing protein n=1 Tax=Psychrobacter sp. B29-1 TaxID=1867800 RepID=UPI00086AB350|nr:VRR-NUC domain-containing protein [Psychrobacter sp. B29-1]OEH66781.1 MAG: hypothetical protein BAX61_13330 [Psychrobacter sp. B29-1]